MDFSGKLPDGRFNIVHIPIEDVVQTNIKQVFLVKGEFIVYLFSHTAF